MDAGDCYRLIMHKPSVHKSDTIKKRPLGPIYTPIPYVGYALVTGYLAGFANNISFYTHHDSDAKISSILFDDIYTQYKQYINIVRSNIWLNHEKINLLGDWRYYKFPTNTFGLGSSSTLADKDPVDYSHIRVNEVMMANVRKNFSVGMGYNLDYHWNIREINPSHTLTDFDRYGITQKSSSSGITLNFQYDNRLNANNPLKGTYANLQVRNNFKCIGSDANWQSATFDFRHYIKLSKTTGNVLALWSYNCITLSGVPPFLDLPSTGWDMYNNTAREYVEGRFRGRNLLYTEAEYRFRITKNGLFGGVLFSNASSVSEWPGNTFQKINYGGGLGLRFKMNKKSNSNFCIDYGIGTNQGKGFSFNLNEVF